MVGTNDRHYRPEKACTDVFYFFFSFFFLPGSYRLQELMCNVTFHEGAEAEGGSHPPTPGHHLQSTVPSVTQGSPNLTVPMMPVHP